MNDDNVQDREKFVNNCSKLHFGSLEQEVFPNISVTYRLQCLLNGEGCQ